MRCSLPVFAVAILFVGSLAVDCVAERAAPERSSAPRELEVRVQFRKVRPQKPPLRAIVCDLYIRNRRETPVWIVHPAHAEQRLPPSGEIKVEYWEPTFFPADGYGIQGGYWPRKPGNVGSFVQVHSLGGEKSRDKFYAMLLPAGGVLEIKGYSFPAWENVESIEIWEAKDIVINGKTSLRDWLPFRVLADKQVRMREGTTSNNNMNWDIKKSRLRDDLRKEAVTTIAIKALSRKLIPIRGER